MNRTTNPSEHQIIDQIRITSTRLRSPQHEGENFQSMWIFLNTVGRFRALEADDQTLFFQLALTASQGATRNGYETYTRAVLKSLQLLNRFPGDYSGVRALFSTSSFYERVGVWDTTKAKRNGRIAALKKYLDAAVDLGLTDANHLDHMKTVKIKRAATPAPEEAVAQAIERVVERITARVGWWKIIA